MEEEKLGKKPALEDSSPTMRQVPPLFLLQNIPQFSIAFQICSNIQKKGWKIVRDKQGRIGPYAYLRDQWVSFDDIGMIRHKSEYIKAMGLGGGMIWALDLDDFKNECGCEEYPLLRTINRVLRDYKVADPKCVLGKGNYLKFLH